MSATPPRILIVEDSPAMRQLLALALKRLRGAEIAQAEDGVEAIRMLKDEGRGFDMVMLDLNMPIMDGMKLLSLIQQDPTITPRALCVVTTEQNEKTEEQARALGASHFLRKPINRRQVEVVLAEVFDASQVGRPAPR